MPSPSLVVSQPNPLDSEIPLMLGGDCRPTCYPCFFIEPFIVAALVTFILLRKFAYKRFFILLAVALASFGWLAVFIASGVLFARLYNAVSVLLIVCLPFVAEYFILRLQFSIFQKKGLFKERVSNRMIILTMASSFVFSVLFWPIAVLIFKFTVPFLFSLCI